MTKILVTLAAMAALTSSAQAQCFPNGIPGECDASASNAEIAKCGYIEIRLTESGSLEFMQTAFAPGHVFRVSSLVSIGREAMYRGIESQTKEPMDDVRIEAALDKQTQQVIPGKFELAMHDHTGSTATRWSNEGSQCNDAANALINQAIAAAKRAGY